MLPLRETCVSHDRHGDPENPRHHVDGQKGNLLKRVVHVKQEQRGQFRDLVTRTWLHRLREGGAEGRWSSYCANVS